MERVSTIPHALIPGEREGGREGAKRQRERKRERDGQPPGELAECDGWGSEGAIEEEMIEKQKEELSI